MCKVNKHYAARPLKTVSFYPKQSNKVGACCFQSPQAAAYNQIHISSLQIHHNPTQSPANLQFTMSKTTFTFSILILLFFASTFIANAIPGGRTKIKDVKTNTEIQQLGKYSVDEYNQSQRAQKTAAGDLKFSKVVAAETQVVAGTKYYLKIEAVTKSGDLKVFDAEVVVKPWAHSKQLLGFKPSPANK